MSVSLAVCLSLSLCVHWIFYWPWSSSDINTNKNWVYEKSTEMCWFIWWLHLIYSYEQSNDFCKWANTPESCNDKDQSKIRRVPSYGLDYLMCNTITTTTIHARSFPLLHVQLSQIQQQRYHIPAKHTHTHTHNIPPLSHRSHLVDTPSKSGKTAQENWNKNNYYLLKAYSPITHTGSLSLHSSNLTEVTYNKHLDYLEYNTKHAHYTNVKHLRRKVYIKVLKTRKDILFLPYLFPVSFF